MHNETYRLIVIVGPECLDKPDNVLMTANLENSNFSQNFLHLLLGEDLIKSLHRERLAASFVVDLLHDAKAACEYFSRRIEGILSVR